jgi:hypothetical protein
MSSKSSIQKPAAVAATGVEPLTPEQIVEQLRILRAHIPDFGPMDTPDAATLRRTASVRDELIQSATNAAGASPEVVQAIGKDADVMRAERLDVGRWSAVQDELLAMYKGVAAANLVRRHRLGISTLQTYFITQQLVRQREHAHLLPHVAEMRRVSKFGRRRQPQAEPPVTPAPSVPAKP